LTMFLMCSLGGKLLMETRDAENPGSLGTGSLSAAR
jgi:hypothetical protein